MNRHYTAAEYKTACDLLRQYMPLCGLTTDLIVGFPEETEEEFLQTLDFIRRCGFAQMHIFPYSVRPGTKAAKMRQLTMAVKEERAARAAEVAEQMHAAYLASCVSKTFAVLFEQEKDGKFVGHAPNYMEVAAQGCDLHNVVRNVRITAVENGMLTGEIV